MKPRVSIVIPSHNRYPQNRYSLYALEQQTFDLSRLEVILVDDASTDDTVKLRHYRPKFRFRYVRNRKKLGVAKSRNVGGRLAEGQVVIFLDAEMIVDRDYVRNHYKHHEAAENNVVIGGEKRAKLYSFLFPGMSKSQIADVCRLAERSEFRTLLRAQGLPSGTPGKIKRSIGKLKRPIPLIGASHIKSFAGLAVCAAPKTNINEILQQLGGRLETSPLRWMVCVGNLSVRKSLFDRLGGYDEDFTEWGTEDVEFAYRLHSAGARFVIEPELWRYHQEHPNPANKIDSGRRNRILLQKKHPVLDVCIRSLKSVQKLDYVFMDEALREHRALRASYSWYYKEFIACIVYMLRRAAVLHERNAKIAELTRGFPSSLKTAVRQRNRLDADGRFPRLVRLFDLLAKRSRRRRR
ncbi:glycosyltransferase [Paenibacillus sp.]|uniref:glycosyltransferase family 2 protein n=1 Tax=Paenibacillus sp. TaxID=58172 RepID=UPI0028118641|nr:glycosyltransferase [Paenibacillus sp.]